MDFTHRAAKNSEILTEAKYTPSVNTAVTDNYPIAKVGMNVHIEVIIPMGYKTVNLRERIGVEQGSDSVASSCSSGGAQLVHLVATATGIS
jgi:hypothetical protein